MKLVLPIASLLLLSTVAQGEQWTVLFDGTDLDHWESRAGAWSINDDGVLYCNMETVTAKNGAKRERGMGYIWTRESFDDFELTLQYKLSEGANSGVFFRTDKDNPVQAGFEVQLMDDEGWKKARGGEIDAKHANAAFYDAQAASSNAANPAGQWNRMTIRCEGPQIEISVNGKLVNEVNVDRWQTAGKNPDGTSNKFKTALKDLPRTGRIGLQNHGQIVWFKDIRVKRL